MHGPGAGLLLRCLHGGASCNAICLIFSTLFTRGYCSSAAACYALFSLVAGVRKLAVRWLAVYPVRKLQAPGRCILAAVLSGDHGMLNGLEVCLTQSTVNFVSTSMLSLWCRG